MVVKKQGDPIGLVGVTKITASRNEIAKNYFGVNGKFSEEKCNESFLELVYCCLLTHERYYLYDLKKIDPFSCSNTDNNDGGSSSIQVDSQEPIMMVKYVDDGSGLPMMTTAIIEERRGRRKFSQFIIISTLLLLTSLCSFS